ncbi:AraC family transcriptional regulator [Vibrio ziniensis]|uniref:AraC family transcriptional regulator n=1 Tax=Vibrio ziniensis TaxID=2711221 RepID=A0A6G7CN39_9VIBR|nr:AraC family transcriptional regulator [Vibrio ziniensis]QIH43551.1 AraC family transcriptional regulator [Vibrio ziniensis]
MNYAIQSEICSFPYLEVTPRKRATKHSLVKVNRGLALFKLGKQEYAIEAGCAIWIPIECLCSLTFLPNTHITRVDFSVRLRDEFPHQSGFIKLTELSSALLNRIQAVKTSDEVYPHLLQVLKDEVKKLEPKLVENDLTKQLSLYQPNQPDNLSKEHQVALLIREAMKRKLSGTKLQTIIDELFSGNAAQFEQMCQLVLGNSL